MEAFQNNLSLIDPDINHFDINIDFQSHSVDSFNKDINILSNSLTIYHNNARSIMSKGKMDLYSTLFFKELETTFDVLIFTETWRDDSNSNQCNFYRYQSTIHLLRPIDKTEYKSIGGVSIFIKANIQYKQRIDLNIMLPHME